MLSHEDEEEHPYDDEHVEDPTEVKEKPKRRPRNPAAARSRRPRSTAQGRTRRNRAMELRED